jgi:hypothetical protein
MDAEEFLNFNLFIKNLTIGLPIKDTIAAIMIYETRILISLRRYNPIKILVIISIDFNIPLAIIFFVIHKYIIY